MERDKIVDREKEGAEEGEEEKEKEGGSKSAVLQKDLPAKIKEEPRDEILKDYAENTMNELLGLYGYDKVINSSDTENLNLDRYTSTSTPIEGRFSLTDDEARDDVSLDSCDSSSGKSDQSKYGRSRSNSESNLAAQHRNLVTALTKKHGLTGVPEGTLPSGYVVCAWCQKPGGKNFTLKTEEKKTKTFCSEVCFTQCRRASFKKNKICDWCKHVRHTVNYVDFQDGETQLQFCSSKCLNQYKMNIFCKETQEHLQQIQSPGENIRDTASPNKILITPDLWLKNGRAEKREHGDDDGDEKLSSKSAKKEKETDVPKVELDNHETSSVHEGERMSIMNRKVLNNAYRERSRKSLRRESPTRPTSQNSDVRAIPSPCLSNPNMAALNSWLSPHMWGSFGMAPMGALPPWYYPGLLPPGMPAGLLPPPADHVTTQQDRHRLNVSPSNRTNSSMEYDSDSSSGTISAHRKSPRNISLKRSTRSSETSSHLPVNPFPPQLPPVPIAHQNGSPRPYNPASLMPPGASNVPPMTMIMPVPVPVPMPVPIPLPLPITMEKIMEVFDKNKDKTESSVAEGTIKTKADCNGLDSRHPLNGRDMKNDINENDMSRDRLSCISCSSDRSGSVGSCPELSSTHSDVLTPSEISSFYRNRDLQHVKDERSDFRKSFRHEDTYSDSCEEAIDLSRNSGDKTRQKADDIRLNGAEKLDESTSSAEDEGGIKVPKIHIISPRAEPPLSQQLPLPPIDPKFASRRGLILDAPGVPKRQRSPSPDRRSYARTVPRDVMEAARRRCLRARVRTK